jgi:hypothetical protein
MGILEITHTVVMNLVVLGLVTGAYLTGKKKIALGICLAYPVYIAILGLISMAPNGFQIGHYSLLLKVLFALGLGLFIIYKEIK